MVDHIAIVDVGESFAGQPLALFLLVEPRGQSLLHDPAAGTLEPLGHQIEFFGQRKRYMRKTLVAEFAIRSSFLRGLQILE